MATLRFDETQFAMKALTKISNLILQYSFPIFSLAQQPNRCFKKTQTMHGA